MNEGIKVKQGGLTDYQSLHGPSSPPAWRSCRGCHSKLGSAARESLSSVQTARMNPNNGSKRELNSTAGLCTYVTKNKINNNNNHGEAAHLVSLLQEDIETFPLVRLGALVQSVNPLKQDT